MMRVSHIMAIIQDCEWWRMRTLGTGRAIGRHAIAYTRQLKFKKNIICPVH